MSNSSNKENKHQTFRNFPFTSQFSCSILNKDNLKQEAIRLSQKGSIKKLHFWVFGALVKPSEISLLYFCFILLLSVGTYILGLECEVCFGAGKDRAWGESVESWVRALFR